MLRIASLAKRLGFLKYFLPVLVRNQPLITLLKFNFLCIIGIYNFLKEFSKNLFGSFQKDTKSNDAKNSKTRIENRSYKEGWKGIGVRGKSFSNTQKKHWAKLEFFGHQH